jgi:hypothetical protein
MTKLELTEKHRLVQQDLAEKESQPQMRLGSERLHKQLDAIILNPSANGIQ